MVRDIVLVSENWSGLSRRLPVNDGHPILTGRLRTSLTLSWSATPIGKALVPRRQGAYFNEYK